MTKRKNTMEIYSVFGQIESVAANIMIERGEATRIDADEIPESAMLNKIGQRAQFAVMMPKSSVLRFNKLIADLYA